MFTRGRIGQGVQEWTEKRRMLGEAGHFSLEGGEVGGDAVDVKVDEGLLTFLTQEEVTILVVVHEEVFGEDGGADGVA